ncbi:MAG: hypothetical protein KBT12_06545 [Bacteroidales bacterium]|nr:hypothetical protein [Candidatus Physcousia equi]
MKKIIEKTFLGMLALFGMSSCNRTKTDVQGDLPLPGRSQMKNKTEEFRCIYGGPDMMFRQVESVEPQRSTPKTPKTDSANKKD